MEVEHVMPQTWKTYWNPAPGLTPEAEAARERAINTIGNLTLVNQKLNASLSNRPWTDAEAKVVAPKGERPARASAAYSPSTQCLS